MRGFTQVRNLSFVLRKVVEKLSQLRVTLQIIPADIKMKDLMVAIDVGYLFLKSLYLFKNVGNIYEIKHSQNTHS